MSFHALFCHSDDYQRLGLGLAYHLFTPYNEELRVGDIIRLDERWHDGELTGNSLMRQLIVLKQYVQECLEPTSSLLLVPLDYPPMSQLELTNYRRQTFVYWVGSHEKFEVGSTIRLLGHSIAYVISQVATTVAADALPDKAEVAFLLEVVHAR